MTAITEPTDAVKVLIARARWRADLLNFHAAEITRIVGDDTSPAAGTFVAQATAKQVEATVHLDHADAAERLSIAKREYDDNPKDLEAKARLDAAGAAMVELRNYWRSIGEYSGSRRGYVASVDDFPEPSDGEVLATHGAVN